MSSQPKNILITDVELNWAKLDAPAQNPFGGPPSWELQIATDDADKASELKAMGLNVKEKDGKSTVNTRRKSVRADGSPMDPVRVVGKDKQPIQNRRAIGNGSKGNVILWAAPYENMGRKGVSFSLTAVQVTEMVEYTGGSSVDFDMVADEGSSSEAPLF